jgi:hypothetical protein
MEGGWRWKEESWLKVRNQVHARDQTRHISVCCSVRAVSDVMQQTTCHNIATLDFGYRFKLREQKTTYRRLAEKPCLTLRSRWLLSDMSGPGSSWQPVGCQVGEIAYRVSLTNASGPGTATLIHTVRRILISVLSQQESNKP